MRRLLFALLVLVSISACRDDFELNAPYKDIPVVYAYLNGGEDQNFVRVQKAFLGSDGNAEVASRNADSLYYEENEATVSLSLGGGDPVILERVNGDDLGLARDTGLFANSPNWLYQVPASFNLAAGRTVNLTVERPGETAATSSTQILSPMDIRFPSNAMGVVLSSYRGSTNIRWSVGEGAPSVYDIRIFMNIREFNTNNPGTSETKRLEFVVAQNYEPDTDATTVSYSMSNEQFWRFLGNSLEENAAIIRRFEDMDIVVTGVGQEIEDAINLAQANGGITSAQSTPVYSNIANGLGIFTSRVIDTEMGVGLDPRNNDTLRNGIFTAPLNFQ